MKGYIKVKGNTFETFFEDPNAINEKLNEIKTKCGIICSAVKVDGKIQAPLVTKPEKEQLAKPILGKRSLRIPPEFHELYYKLNPDLTLTLEEETHYDMVDLEHEFMDFVIPQNMSTRH